MLRKRLFSRNRQKYRRRTKWYLYLPYYLTLPIIIIIYVMRLQLIPTLSLEGCTFTEDNDQVGKYPLITRVIQSVINNCCT